MQSYVLEGGSVRRSGGIFPNVNTLFFGSKGEEEEYVRTNRSDSKGRVIFVFKKKHTKTGRSR